MRGYKPDGRLSQSAILSYSTTALGISVFSVAINVMVPQLYAKELGISLVNVGLALFVIRVFDAVNDQVVGILSDRTRSRFGSRKPWVVGGTIITLVSCYYLLIPGPGVDIGYFILWRMVYDVGWTMTSVAYTAWGAELSPNYAERSRINGYAGIGTNLGSLFKNIAPIVLFWLGFTETSAFSLEQLGYLFWICLVMIPVLTGISLVGAPQGQMVQRSTPDMRGIFKSLKSNRPFWFYLFSFSVGSLGQGILALLFTFYDSYLKVGQWYPYMMAGFGVVAVLAIPLWVRVCDLIGKHKAYAIALFINVGSIQAFWFIDPSAHSQETVAIFGAIVIFFIAFGAACNYVAPAAMLADIVDYGAWKTGDARTGSYFAFHSLIIKIAAAVGSGAGFLMLAAFGYKVTEGAVNSDAAKLGLVTTVVLVPAILKGMGALIIWNFPLTAGRHDVIRRRLAARNARTARIDAEVLPEPGAIPTNPRVAPST